MDLRWPATARLARLALSHPELLLRVTGQRSPVWRERAEAPSGAAGAARPRGAHRRHRRTRGRRRPPRAAPSPGRSLLTGRRRSARPRAYGARRDRRHTRAHLPRPRRDRTGAHDRGVPRRRLGRGRSRHPRPDLSSAGGRQWLPGGVGRLPPLHPSTPSPPRSTTRSPRTAGCSSTPTQLGAAPGGVAVMGDSAGGNLAAVVGLEARRLGLPLPTLQCLIYPALDCHFRTESCQTFAEGFGLTLEAMHWYRDRYVPHERDWNDPRLRRRCSPGT
ncbi:MAG: alpha/beta hydrolase fold domain-containing protein [Acidimicrobiia bacterium]|nr:alpha/beta hydrolase fold domain-containing protein [Acidimicrobiia bacterium]